MDAIAWASSRRPLPFLKAGRSLPESTLRNRRGTAGPGRPGLPRMKTCGSTGFGESLTTIARGRRAGVRGVQLLNRGIQLLEPVALALIEDEPHSVAVDGQRPAVAKNRLSQRLPFRFRQGGNGGRAFDFAACSFDRVSSWAKSDAYRSTTSPMLAGGPASTTLATSG